MTIRLIGPDKVFGYGARCEEDPMSDQFDKFESLPEERREAIPVSYTHLDVYKRQLEAGVTAFLSKPLFRSKLYYAMKSVCGDTDGASRVAEREQTRDCSGKRVLLVEDNELNICLLSTSYAAFDESPVTIDPEAHVRALEASRAEEVPLCNNLTAASESLMPELAEMLGWIAAQDGVENSLMSGSGSSAFAICTTFDDACRIVAAARNRGWWARATAFSSAKVSAIPR